MNDFFINYWGFLLVGLLQFCICLVFLPSLKMLSVVIHHASTNRKNREQQIRLQLIRTNESSQPNNPQILLVEKGLSQQQQGNPFHKVSLSRRFDVQFPKLHMLETI
jgi:hypothetical protein